VPGVPEYEYRDGGRAGDAIVRELITGVGSVLAPGGVAQLLGNWEVRSGADWHERIGAWIDEAGLDGWVIQRELQDPAEYAETWIRDGGSTPDRDRAAWDAQYAAWLDDFASRDVVAIGFGIVTLRRPSPGGRPCAVWRSSRARCTSPWARTSPRASPRTTGSGPRATTCSRPCTSRSPAT